MWFRWMSWHLLNKLRFQLDKKAVVTIYKSSIIPVLTHFSILSITNDKSRADCFKSIDSRATRIVSRNADQAHTITWPSIASIKKKHTCTFVRKCIDGKFVRTLQNISVCWATKNALEITQLVWICHLSFWICHWIFEKICLFLKC